MGESWVQCDAAVCEAKLRLIFVFDDFNRVEQYGGMQWFAIASRCNDDSGVEELGIAL